MAKPEGKTQYDEWMAGDIADGRIANAIFDNCLFIDGLAKVLGDLCSVDGDVQTGPIEVSAESLWTIGRLIEDQIAEIGAKAEAVQERVMESRPNKPDRLEQASVASAPAPEAQADIRRGLKQMVPGARLPRGPRRPQDSRQPEGRGTG